MPQVHAWNSSIVIGVLPVASFASGHTFFVQKLYEVQRATPYVVHTTFQARWLRAWRLLPRILYSLGKSGH